VKNYSSENLFQAEMISASPVITAATTLLIVITVFPLHINPTSSTQSDIAVCTARDATVNKATPTIGTT
jgi:hypothetical protein